MIKNAISTIRAHPVLAAVLVIAGIAVAFAYGRFFGPVKTLAAKLPGAQA